jgi:hypothetical protein
MNKRRRFKAKRARQLGGVRGDNQLHWLRSFCARHRREMRERYAVIHIYA